MDNFYINIYSNRIKPISDKENWGSINYSHNDMRFITLNYYHDINNIGHQQGIGMSFIFGNIFKYLAW